jgi:cell division protein FtsQ
VDAARLLPSGKVLVAAFASLAFTTGVYAVARGTPMFALRRIEITGTDAAGRAEASRALADLQGRSLLAIGGGDIGRRLAQLPDVAHATYDRDFPHTLRVTIVPERPVAVLRRGAETWLVAGSARVLRRIRRGTFRSLPRVWAPESTTVALGSRVDGPVAATAAALARLGETPLPRRVRGATDTDADGLTFLLDNGLAVRLGDATEIDLKLAIAARIVPLVPAGSTLLDVSVPERPVSENSQVEG